MGDYTNGSSATHHGERDASLTVTLDEGVATKIELAQVRVESAVNAHAARKAELENLILQVRAHYEERGKYTVLTIDPVARKVERAPVDAQGAPNLPRVEADAK